MEKIHDNCKKVIMFHNNFIKFLKTLKTTLPECKEQISTCVKYYKSISRADFIGETSQLLEPHIGYISENDYGIFSDDYQKGERFLIPKIDFRKIFDIIDQNPDFVGDYQLQEATRNSIFKHLQAIYISANMALKEIGIFDHNMEKQKKHLLNMLDNLRIDDEVKEKIKQLEQDESANGEWSLEKLSEMLGEDNFVFQIAKDVAQELDLGKDSLDDPVSTIKDLFSDGGSKIKELIVSIGDKLEGKMESGQYDREKIIQDTMKLKSKLGGLVPSKALNINQEETMKRFKFLKDELKEKFSLIPDLTQKPILEWDDGEHELYQEFMELTSITS
jgi:hypothetical protein